IASNHAVATIEHIGAYAAAKGGVVSLTRSMALELGKDRIRVNAVCPGFIQTAKLDSFLAGKPDRDRLLAEYVALHPLGRMGTPQDVAHLTAFLLSDYAEFITGACVVIDGGVSGRLF